MLLTHCSGTRIVSITLILLLSFLALSRFRETTPLLKGLHYPEPFFSRGFSLLQEERLSAKVSGAELCREGLRHFPWYGPGWLCLGIATQSWLGDLAALPLYELAEQLDPQGRGVKEYALPVLLRHKRIPLASIVPARLFPQPPRSLVAALPEEPPPSWLTPPLLYSPTFLEPFYLERRWRWLAVLEESKLARELTPAARGYALYGFCIHKGLEECRERWKLCKEKAPPCAQGASLPEGALLHLAEEASKAGKLSLAEEFVREEFGSTGSDKARELLIRVLKEQGKTREAMRLKGVRTHRSPR